MNLSQVHRRWSHVWQLQTKLSRVICSTNNSEKRMEIYVLSWSFLYYVFLCATEDLWSGMGGVCIDLPSSWLVRSGSLCGPMGCRTRLFNISKLNFCCMKRHRDIWCFYGVYPFNPVISLSSKTLLKSRFMWLRSCTANTQCIIHLLGVLKKYMNKSTSWRH